MSQQLNSAPSSRAVLGPCADRLSRLCLMLLAIPVHRALQPLQETDFRVVSKRLSGCRDIGVGVFDIAFPWRTILRWVLVTGQLGDQAIGLVQRIRFTAGAVEHTSSHLFHGRRGRFQVCLDNVFDVGKVAAVLAIAIDSRLLAGQHPAASSIIFANFAITPL